VLGLGRTAGFYRCLARSRLCPFWWTHCVTPCPDMNILTFLKTHVAFKGRLPPAEYTECLEHADLVCWRLMNPDGRAEHVHSPEYAEEVTAAIAEVDPPLAALGVKPVPGLEPDAFADVTMLQWLAMTPAEQGDAVIARVASGACAAACIDALTRAARRQLAALQEFAECSMHRILSPEMGGRDTPDYAGIDAAVGTWSVLEWKRLSRADQEAAVGGWRRALIANMAVGHAVFESAFM